MPICSLTCKSNAKAGILKSVYSLYRIVQLKKAVFCYTKYCACKVLNYPTPLLAVFLVFIRCLFLIPFDIAFI